MTNNRKRVFALVGMLLLAAGGVAAYAGRDAAGIRLDDRSRDGAVCGTGDEDNQCDGAKQLTTVPNSRRHEYTIIWEGWYSYTHSPDDGVRLYARTVDAATGQPKGPSVELAPTGIQYPFAATYDPATRTYVVAWQMLTEPGSPAQYVQVQRFDESLKPIGLARTLAGNWDLKAVAVETEGRVAVIGAENEQAVNWPVHAGIGPLALHVETLDAQDQTISVTRLDADGPGFANGVAATYEPWAHRLLVAWIPTITQQGARNVRVDQVDPSGAEGTVTLLITPGVPIWQANLACNELRRDCLLLYAGGGPELADLHARLIGPDGQPQGNDVVVASNTRGPIGAGASGNGYTFAWNQDGVSAPTGAHVVVGRLIGSAPQIETVNGQTLAGQAQFAVAPGRGTGLLAWRPQVDHPAWFQIRGQVVH